MFSAFAVLASFMLIMSVCLCGVPEKKNTLKFVSRYWMLQIGLNALFQSIENLYNTLPDSQSVFVLELPGIGKIKSFFTSINWRSSIKTIRFLCSKSGFSWVKGPYSLKIRLRSRVKIMMGVSFDIGVGFDILGISSICNISYVSYDQSLDILLKFKFVYLTAMPTLGRFA